MADGAALPATRFGAAPDSGVRRLGLGLGGPLPRFAGAVSPELMKRAAPLLFGLGALALAVFAWSLLAAPARVAVFPGLTDVDKAAVAQALEAGGFDVEVDSATGAVEVAARDLQRARMALAAQGLPKAVPGGYDLLGDMPLGASRGVERARLKQAQEGELARAIEGVGGVRRARVMLALPEPSPFVRETSAPSASVFLSLESGRALAEGQVRAIQNLVATSVPGLSTERVSVVDGAGELLSSAANGGELGESARQLEYRQRIERMYRERATALLTPVVGPGNFTTQVNLDLDFTRAEATSERYDPQATALRSEATSSRQDASVPARGIPGALSNVAPPPVIPSPTPNPATPSAEGAVPPAPVGPTNSEASATRNYEVSREVSVKRDPVGSIRKLAVAVVIRSDAAGGVDPRALQSLISAALGADARRGDVVTVVRAPFATESPMAEPPVWRQMTDRHLSKVLVLLGVIALALITRPLWRGKRDAADRIGAKALEPIDLAAPAGAEPADLTAPDDDMPALTDGASAEDEIAARLAALRQPPTVNAADILSAANSYDDKVAAIRLFVAEDTARAATVMKRMLTDAAQEI